MNHPVRIGEALKKTSNKKRQLNTKFVFCSHEIDKSRTGFLYDNHKYIISHLVSAPFSKIYSPL